MSATEAPRRLRAADVIDAQQATIERLTERTPRVSEMEVEVERKSLAGKEPHATWRVKLPEHFNEAELERMTTRAIAAYQTLDAALVSRTNGEAK